MKLLTLLALVLALCASCSPSHAETIAPYVERSDGLREQLTQIAELVGRDSSAATGGVSLDPGLVLVEGTLEGNAEIISIEELRDFDDDDVPMELYLADSTSTMLSWTAPERRDDSYAGGDAEFMRDTIEHALALRYLVVYKQDEYTAPRITGDSEFRSGEANLTCWIVDVASQSIVGRFSAQARNSESVQVMSSEDRSARDDVNAWLRSDLYTETRNAVVSQLTEVFSARIVLK